MQLILKGTNEVAIDTVFRQPRPLLLNKPTQHNPIVGFHFSVVFELLAQFSIDTKFQSVTGLKK